MDDPRQQIGRNLAAMRDDAKLTQETLAAKIGVTRVTVARWETGAASPDLLTLPAIAAALGVSVSLAARKLTARTP